MAMQFEELDAETRRWMSIEFEAEQLTADRYRSKTLTPAGHVAYLAHMRTAIAGGCEIDLIANLSHGTFWFSPRGHAVNVPFEAGRLGLSEFNTWYVRGLARRLKEEGVPRCQAYRASQPTKEYGECSAHEGKIYPVGEIYLGHRARYHPVSDDTKVSIPYGPNCHHTIRRVV